jgi:hypothetical protein
MKNLFKKSWFFSILISSVVLILFLINLWIMSLNLKFPYQDESILALASNISDGGFEIIYAFVLMIVFFASIIPMLLSGFSLLRKHSWGIVITVLYNLGFSVALFVFQSLYNLMSTFSIILIIFNIIFALALFVLLIFRAKMIDFKKEDRVIEINDTKLPIIILVIDILSVLVFLSTFVIPLYSTVEANSTYHASIIRVLFAGDTNIRIMIYFLANFAIFLGIFLFFADALTHYFLDKENFIQKSKSLIASTFAATIAFFLTGLAFSIFLTITWENLNSTIAFIPMFMMLIVVFIHAILIGKYDTVKQKAQHIHKPKYSNIETLLFVILMTAITVFMLFLPIISIDIIFGSYTYDVDLNGFNILRDYLVLDPGYRIVAFILVVMLITVGLGLVITITSYLSKYKRFNSIVRFVTGINVFFIFIVSISGYYFQIAKEINQVVILDIVNFYGVGLPGGLDFDYVIGTQSIYALIAATLVLMIMFLRKVFDRDEEMLLEANITDSNNTGSNQVSYDEEVFNTFDPAPSFTELDAKVDLFKEDLKARKALKVKDTTLNNLVNFVVDYARNSRLHLSYTPEDIATFVSGLGASRLSILQGMSGTGKTSLPKIFSEAIFGNCEIIEVESSWKDKNELLGYYNEFSMKYTPKKFTLALYKAALNKEIFTFILLDEMNLSRIEYYFSDFLSLMENEEGHREIKLINLKLNRKEEDKDIEYSALDEGHTLKIPSNVWFIGTANRDESTFVISDKVYDRAHTMNFTKRAPKVRSFSEPISKQYYDYETINELFVRAKQNGSFDAESSELIKSIELLLAPYNISFGNRILKQIEDFVNIYKACFLPEDVEAEAIEKILLSKVVAKLEVKTIEDKEKLEQEFVKLNLNLCAAFIRSLDDE